MIALETLSFKPESTALVIIDMQRDFCSPKGYAARAGINVNRLARPIARIQQLLNAARQAKLLVVHTREGHLPDLSDCPPEKLRRSVAAGAAIGSQGPMGRLLVRGEFGHDFIDELQPMASEVVIDKPGYGAFHQTKLAGVLAQHAMTTLIICGVTTEVCVHSTLREAVDRGFSCITVADATAASNPALQRPAIDMISVEGGIFGRVATTSEVVAILDRA